MIVINPNGITLRGRGLAETATTTKPKEPTEGEQLTASIGGIITGLFGTGTAIAGSILQANAINADYKARMKLLEEQKKIWAAEREQYAAGGGATAGISPVLIFVGIGIAGVVVYFLTR